ncbi:MAG: hypothetical protein Q8865_05400 [Bacillota bacterium]|nr:hypothetical protein [Bacillota bacterium]
MKKSAVFIALAMLIFTASADKPSPQDVPAADARVVQAFIRVNNSWTSIGKFTVTAYCPCKKCCGKWSDSLNPITASGAPAVEGVTVGADFSILKPGTRIFIDGIGERIVQDRTAGWVSDKYNGRILDLFFTSHADAAAFGKLQCNVFILGDPYQKKLIGVAAMSFRDRYQFKKIGQIRIGEEVIVGTKPIVRMGRIINAERMFYSGVIVYIHPSWRYFIVRYNKCKSFAGISDVDFCESFLI